VRFGFWRRSELRYRLAISGKNDPFPFFRAGYELGQLRLRCVNIDKRTRQLGKLANQSGLSKMKRILEPKDEPTQAFSYCIRTTGKGYRLGTLLKPAKMHVARLPQDPKRVAIELRRLTKRAPSV